MILNGEVRESGLYDRNTSLPFVRVAAQAGSHMEKDKAKLTADTCRRTQTFRVKKLIRGDYVSMIRNRLIADIFNLS